MDGDRKRRWSREKNGRWEVEESTGRGEKLWTPATVLKRLATNI